MVPRDYFLPGEGLGGFGCTQARRIMLHGTVACLCLEIMI